MRDLVYSNAAGTKKVVVTVASTNDNTGGELQVMTITGAEDDFLTAIFDDSLKVIPKSYPELVALASDNNLTLEDKPHSSEEAKATKNTATALDITSTDPLAGGNDSVAYTDTVETEGGNGQLTFSVSAGSLPSGLTLNPLTGVISGTPDTVENPSFTIKVVDELGVETTEDLSIDIQA